MMFHPIMNVHSHILSSMFTQEMIEMMVLMYLIYLGCLKIEHMVVPEAYTVVNMFAKYEDELFNYVGIASTMILGQSSLTLATCTTKPRIYQRLSDLIRHVLRGIRCQMMVLL